MAYMWHGPILGRAKTRLNQAMTTDHMIKRMVEAAGVEPASEVFVGEASTSLAGRSFLTQREAVRQPPL